MKSPACAVCKTVSTALFPVASTKLMPFQELLEECLRRYIKSCPLPLLSTHAMCDSCHRTLLEVDQLLQGARMLCQKLDERSGFRSLEATDTILHLGPAELPEDRCDSELPLSPDFSVPVPGNSLYTCVATKPVAGTADLCASPSPEPHSAVEESLTKAGKAEYAEDGTICVTEPAVTRDLSASDVAFDEDDSEESKDPIKPRVADDRARHRTPDSDAAEDNIPAVPSGRSEASPRAARVGPKTCSHCGRSYRRWRDLDTHLSVHSGVKPHRCSDCGRGFASRRRLADHRRGHGAGWPCSDCDKVFRHPSGLSHHRRVHEDSPPASVTCPVCSRSLAGTSQLTAHLRTHTGERPYSCPDCPRAFRQATSLRVHRRLHSGEKPFRCEKCGRDFRAKAAYMTHLQRHGTVPTRFTCDICAKEFFYKSRMEAHRTIHGLEKTSCCEVCGLTFGSLASLSRHKISHSALRPHVCAVCGKCFKEAGVLRKHHRQMHSGNRAHSCPVCGKRCASPFKLREHERTHTGERPFACDLCPKAFTQAVHLNVHKRVHRTNSELA